MLDRTPHIFISYSWTTEDFQARVKELAERLMHDGVDVRLDIWDLKDGQDKYAFMEQCVTDPEIDRVQTQPVPFVIISHLFRLKYTN